LQITVNGERQETRATTLAELCAALGYGEMKVATALNGDFVAAGSRARTALSPDDRIEIVAPRQGG
jgi:sulfur carrier protein